MVSGTFLFLPAVWATSVVGEPDAPARFWESMSGGDFVRRHPVLTRAMWPRAIPVGFYGDAGAFSKQESVFCFTWNSLLGTGSTMHKRFLFTVIRKSLMVSGTLDAIMRIFVWPMDALLTGMMPEANWLGNPIAGGTPIAGGYRGVFAKLAAIGIF